MTALVDVFDQRLEVRHSAFEKLQLMGPAQMRRSLPSAFQTGKPNSAISGKWSDMRPQMRPRGTSAPNG